MRLSSLNHSVRSPARSSRESCSSSPIIGVGLWVPELGGAVDINNDGHYMALSNYGTMSRAERNRTRLRVANAVRAHAQAGRWLGGRPPYGYLIGDRGPHPNPSKAASGARLHQLAARPGDRTGCAADLRLLSRRSGIQADRDGVD